MPSPGNGIPAAGVYAPPRNLLYRMLHRIHTHLIIGGLLLPLLAAAQFQPVPQPLPYAQDFGALPHGAPVYPEGWRGWRIGNGATNYFETAAPIADLALIANSNAANNGEGIHNYDGKPGMLNSGSLNGALVLSINTTNRQDVSVTYTVMTIRNPWNGSTNTRRCEAALQYRVGTSGPFTTLPGPVYLTPPTPQIGEVTTPQSPQTIPALPLPAACNDKPVVQLRWVLRDASGIGMRPSVAVDDVSITATCVSPTIAYTGSPYCSNGGINGDHAFPTITGSGTGVFSAPGMNIAPTTGAIHLATSNSGTVHYTIAAGNGCAAVETSTEVVISPAAHADAGGPYTSMDGAPVQLSATASGPGLWIGGAGTFDQPADPHAVYTPHSSEMGATVQLTWTTDDPDGSGPCGQVSAMALVIGDLAVYGIMYGGGDGRGDAQHSVDVPHASLNIYSGGTGRGDVSMPCVMPALAAAIFHGGDGRGDVSHGHVIPATWPDIFAGGDGRGDVSMPCATPALEAAIFQGGNGRGDVSHGHVIPSAWPDIFAGGDGRGDAYAAVGLVPVPVALRLRGSLAGPYVAATGLMHDSLRVRGLIPHAEPYTDLGFDLPGGGGETVSPVLLGVAGANAVVDWVVVELRSAADPSILEAASCFLLQRDGDVTGPGLAAQLGFTANVGPHYVALRHRNHLGVMTLAPIELGSEGAPLVDLTLPATHTYGTNARHVVGGHALLWPGDVTGDGRVQYTGSGNDRDPVLQMIGGVVPTNVVHNMYTGADVNMDGKVVYTGQGNDRDPILQVIGGVVPTNVRVEQVP